MPGNKKQVRKGGKKGRIRWPLMPDGLTVQQAWWWHDHRYAHTRNDSIP